MATKWISPTWRMPEESNQSKFSNYSMSFDGTEYIDLGSGFTTTNQFTISAWINPNNLTSSGYGYLLGNNSVNGTGFSLDEGGGAAGAGKFYLYTGTGSISVISTTPLTINNWFYVVFVCDKTVGTKGEIKFYLNGSLDKTTTLSNQDLNSLTSLEYIGYSPSHYINAKLDQVAIFDYGLSETQVKYLYNNNAGGSTPNPQNPMAISGNAPIAYYDLGGSSTGDAAASSPNTLTVPNSSVPSATVFNTTASTQHMDLGGSDLWSNILVGTNRTGLATLSYWIKGPINVGYTNFWTMGTTGSSGITHGAYRVGTSQRINVTFGNTNEYKRFTMPTGIDLDEDTWFHITILYPAGTVTDSSGTATGNGLQDIELYVNAQPCGTDYNTGPDGALSAWGSSNKGVNIFSDQLLASRSNVQIWNSVLTSAEITTLYNNGKPYLGTQPQAANLKGWWRMNLDTSNWDGSDWTISDTSVDWKNSLGFDGASKITTPLDISNSSFTTSVWIKANSSGYTSAGKYAPFNVQSNSTAGINGAINQLYNGSGGGGTGLRPAMQTYEFGTANFQYWFASANNFLDGNWYNVVWTRDSSNSKIQCYVNGQLQTFTSFNGSQTTNALTDHAVGGNPNTPRTYSNVTIGAFKNNSGTIFNNYLGQVSNCAIFNNILTPTQISNIYNNGLPETTISSSPISWWKLDNTTTGIQDSIGSNNGTNDGAVASGIAVSKVNGTSSGMTTANLVNSDLERSIPYSSYSMYMTGSTDDTYFDLSTDIVVGTGGNTTYSWSIWVKPVDDGFTSQVVVFGDSGATDDGSLVLERSGGNFTALVEQTGTELESSAGAVINNAWTHISIVVDSTASTKKMYINGQEDTAVGGTGAGPDGTIKNINSSNTFNQYTGYVSNWAFWNSALSDNNILSIYNGGAPNNLTNLNPTHWWSMSGDSYFNGNNWICPDLIGSNDLTGVNDSGEELVGNGPGSQSNGVGTSMNIPGNLQGNAPNSNANAFSVNMNADDKSSSVPVIP